MSASEVYYANSQKVTPGRGLVIQIDEIFRKAGFSDIIEKGDSVAIKIHTGEAFSDCYIRPSFIRRLVDRVRDSGGLPFVAEATPLYKGSRMTSDGLIEAAAINGYSITGLGCPVVVADGPNITSKNPFNADGVKLKIPDGEEIKEVEIGSAFVRADAMFVCANLTPAGAMRTMLKHVGMGCATKDGKKTIHQLTRPIINTSICIGCGSCSISCAWDAIHVPGRPDHIPIGQQTEFKAVVDYKKCVACMMCWDNCNTRGSRAIGISEKACISHQKRNVEAAAALIRQKKGKCGFFSFLIDIKGECECHTHSKRSTLPDIGILSSKDPVAVTAASYDLINEMPGIHGTIFDGLKKGDDKTQLWPEFRWPLQLTHAEKMGIGTRNYRLIETTD